LTMYRITPATINTIKIVRIGIIFIFSVLQS
jgi:hypothetical protein